MNGTAIVLSDFRLDPLLAVVDLYHKLPLSEIFLSSESLLEGDFGDDVAKTTRLRAISLLCKDFRVTVCASSEADQTIHDYRACMSSLVSFTNDSYATPGRYPDLWARCLRLERGAQAVRRKILQGHHEQIFVFNGKNASTRALTKFAEDQRNMLIGVYEYGVWSGFYTTYPAPLHDRAARGEEMVTWAESKGFVHSKILARRAISVKLKNRFESSLDPASKANCDTLILSGSPHEYLYWSDNPEQVGLDSDLVSLVQHVRGLNLELGSLTIRMHPNMAHDPSFAKIVKRLECAFPKGEVEVISPQSNLSSHEMIENANMVVVAGSSVALDVLYLGKMPIMLEDNEISKVIAASSARFGEVKFIAENVAGLLREYEMRNSKPPSLRSFFFLARYSLTVTPPALRFWVRLLRGLANKVGLGFMSMGRRILQVGLRRYLPMQKG